VCPEDSRGIAGVEHGRWEWQEGDARNGFAEGKCQEGNIGSEEVASGLGFSITLSFGLLVLTPTTAMNIFGIGVVERRIFAEGMILSPDHIMIACYRGKEFVDISAGMCGAIVTPTPLNEAQIIAGEIKVQGTSKPLFTLCIHCLLLISCSETLRPLTMVSVSFTSRLPFNGAQRSLSPLDGFLCFFLERFFWAIF
jgi:hypothetical protein